MSIIGPNKTLKIPTDVTLVEYILSVPPMFGYHAGKFREDIVAFVEPASQTKVTHGELRREIDLIGSGLVNKLKVHRGDVVGLFSPNHVRYASVFLGGLNAGAVMTTSNPMYSDRELTHQLVSANVKVLFVADVLLPIAKRAVAASNLPVKIINIDSTSGGKEGDIMDLTALHCTEPYSKLKFTNNAASASTPALIAFSSGTTGMPKGVLTTHLNLVANLIQSQDMASQVDAHRPAVLGLLPFFHCYGVMVTLLTGVLRNITTVVMRKFEFKEFLDILVKYKISSFNVAPPVILLLAKSPLVDKYDLSFIEEIKSGAAPLPLDVSKLASKRFNCRVSQGYGMTEASPVISMPRPETDKPQSVGELVPNLTAKLIDPASGKMLQPSETGEIWVKGPNIMLGYLNNPRATEEMFDSEGYMRTGDIGYFDKDGDLHIVDRAKELIKYKGYQIAPAELEEALVSHARVKDCCVIGLPDKATAEEHAKGYVVLNGAPPTDPQQQKQLMEDILNHVHQRVAPYKKLRGGLEFIDIIPKSPTGKILRRVLKDKALLKHNL